MKRKTLDRRPAAVLAREASVENEPANWKALTRIAFRFSFLYFGLYCLATQIAGSLLYFPTLQFRGLGLHWPMRDLTFWVGIHVFGVTEPFVYGRNSGETLFYWIQTFWLLAAAVLGTALWSALDRRTSYVTAQKWFRVFVRFALAASMFEYGMTKVIPTQFPRPSLNTLVTPVGNLSLSGLLWTAVGSTPAYEIFTGVVELLGGILLLVPRTTMVGAVISMAAMVQVFVLNMTFDVGLKLLSFHLILLAALLLAPDLSRLAGFFILNRGAGPPAEPPLFRTPRANRIALAAQAVAGVYLLGAYVYVNWTYWYLAGDGSPRSALYGIWNVDQLSINGERRLAALNDYDRRWRRVIFDEPGAVAFQRLDDSFARYGAAIDVYNNTLALTKGNSKHWKAQFRFQRTEPGRLSLEGEMDGNTIRMELQLVEMDTFRLLGSSFRWVRPHEP